MWRRWTSPPSASMAMRMLRASLATPQSKPVPQSANGSFFPVTSPLPSVAWAPVMSGCRGSGNATTCRGYRFSNRAVPVPPADLLPAKNLDPSRPTALCAARFGRIHMTLGQGRPTPVGRGRVKTPWFLTFWSPRLNQPVGMRGKDGAIRRRCRPQPVNAAAGVS
ncbi:protein of unknown function [Paraburkholderia kururiensis]